MGRTKRNRLPKYLRFHGPVEDKIEFNRRDQYLFQIPLQPVFGSTVPTDALVKMLDNGAEVMFYSESTMEFFVELKDDFCGDFAVFKGKSFAVCY